MTRRFLATFAVLGAIGAGFVIAEPTNEKCPVSGEAVDKATAVKHTVVLATCCEKCQAKLEKEPLSKPAAIAEASGKPVNSVCPVSGEDVDDKVKVTHDGVTFALCCEKCQAKAKADPAAALAKVKIDRPGNEKCPVSGEAIDPAVFVKVTQEIGFCCEKCAAKFAADPAAVLKKAS
jgi:YHS domain-containing protein